MTAPRTEVIKVIVIGQSGVGKTSLINCLLDEKFVLNPDQPKTTETRFYRKVFSLQGVTTMLSICDAVVGKRFGSTMEDYLNGAHIAILVFDINSSISFDFLRQWLGQQDTSNVLKVLLGNKVDKKRMIEPHDIENIGRNHQILMYREASILTKRGVLTAFEHAVLKYRSIVSPVGNAQLPHPAAHLDYKSYNSGNFSGSNPAANYVPNTLPSTQQFAYGSAASSSVNKVNYMGSRFQEMNMSFQPPQQSRKAAMESNMFNMAPSFLNSQPQHFYANKISKDEHSDYGPDHSPKMEWDDDVSPNVYNTEND